MIYAKKSLGQNFLIDKNIIKKIVNISNIRNKNVLEIGPGKGALTDQILENQPKSLTLIEKDKLLSDKLKLKYYKNSKIKILNKDILKFDFEKVINENSIIFGNLPYNISSQILIQVLKFKKWPPKYSDLIFMFQREMAERIIGRFGTSKYGRLSIITKYRLEIADKFNISPFCFTPIPKVISTVLHFVPTKKSYTRIKNINSLEKITNIFFSNKRKMINKNIKKIFNKNKKINELKNLDLKARPSEVKPELFYKITQIFEKN
tara:strand:+ start:139 stop:927 length:789 start_codon:yes stop_codon:yes gene_type:complete